MRHVVRSTVIALTVTAATGLGIAPVDAAEATVGSVVTTGSQPQGWLCRLLRMC